MKMEKEQAIVREFCKKGRLASSVEARLIDIVSEAGELSKEVLKATCYGKRKFVKTGELELETGDLIFSVLAFCNSAGIDAEIALKKAIRKYKKRVAVKGSADSGK
jgi:NTP pyrophosphatase (non-canonical NTP hydrolase)